MRDDISGWDDWSDAFSDWSDISISELHGIVSALMTTCEAPTAETWQLVLEELSLNQLKEKTLAMLTEEAEDICFQLKDKDDAYGFNPLVPDDENDLYERVLALKNWCSGYITGLGISDYAFTEQDTQTVSDLAKIASIRIFPDEDFEGGEESYLHIFEFARMVPVSLATKKRKPVDSLRLIKGLSVSDKTATEANQ